jgi:hypothetical protein
MPPPGLSGHFMKVLLTISLCIILGGMYLYNTNWFQSSFLYKQFYQPICDTPFDATKKGKTLSIPLKYKYHTCYDLALTVPDKNVFHERLIGSGLLAYRFLSDGKVLSRVLKNSHPCSWT